MSGRCDPQRKSDPLGMNGLISSALARHGIARQVTSAMVVNDSHDALLRAVPEHMHGDVRVIWYKNDTIFIACRHPAAVEAVQIYIPELEAHIKSTFPSIALSRIDARVRPHMFQEGYR